MTDRRKPLLGWRSLRLFVLVFIFVVGRFVVGDVLAVVNDARRRVVLLVVGVLDDVAHVNVLCKVAVTAGEVQVAFGFGVGGEPVFAVNLFVVGSKGWG